LPNKKISDWQKKHDLYKEVLREREILAKIMSNKTSGRSDDLTIQDNLLVPVASAKSFKPAETVGSHKSADKNESPSPIKAGNKVTLRKIYEDRQLLKSVKSGTIGQDENGNLQKRDVNVIQDILDFKDKNFLSPEYVARSQVELPTEQVEENKDDEDDEDPTDMMNTSESGGMTPA
jgi:hypothetical protein